MKIRREQLALRPIVPQFLKIIPRLPAMVCKKEILFKIFSPITYIFRGIKKAFKKKSPSLKTICQADLELKTQCLVNVQHKSSSPLNLHHQELLHKRKIVAEIFNWQGTRQNTCLSCQEDRPAYNTCRMCQKLYSTLPPSSCRKCQREKPLINLCMKSHESQPVVYLKDEETVSIFKTFFKELKKLQRTRDSTRCNGKTHSINNCPMCLTFWPTVGECACLQCQLTEPVVKVFSQRSRRNMMIDVCPCITCYKTHPKIKVCSTCKSRKQIKLKEDTSFYVLLK